MTPRKGGHFFFLKLNTESNGHSACLHIGRGFYGKLITCRFDPRQIGKYYVIRVSYGYALYLYRVA